MKKRHTQHTETEAEATQTGRPGAGKGRREDVRGSGVYPLSGPLPPGPAKLKTEASMGRRERSTRASSSRAALVRRTTARGQTAAAAARIPPGRAATHRKVASRLKTPPQEIAHEEWEDFLDDFSVEHDGWITDIEVFDPDETSRLEAHDLPLVGVSVDLEPDEPIASVIAGDELADHLTHMLRRTSRITALNENELEIESADRSRTIVRCREPLD